MATSASSLRIFNASAGSGKTYTLAQEYIDILISDPKNYRSILAVTFTKKATAEMKERIVDNLAKISSGDAALLAAQLELAQKTNSKISANDVQERCRTALLLILNDYGQFSVSTIDSFVQRVVRAFAFEAHLNSDLGVELDTDAMLELALNELMKNLVSDKRTLHWLQRFLMTQAEEASKWKIEDSILDLGKDYIGKGALDGNEININTIEELQEELRSIVKSFEDELISFVDNYKKLCGHLDVSDFKGKSNNVFYNLIEKDNQELLTYLVGKSKHINKIQECCEEPTKFFNNSWPSKDVHQHFKQFNQYLNLSKHLREYYTANAAKKYIFAIGVMQKLMSYVKQLSVENHTIMLNESTTLLHRLIDGSDVPFIYEKIGSRYNNVMIDEFQDTSNIQWQNFKPLIDSSLSTNQKCLIVGDVKQAIYRWRGSDWRLLSSALPDYYAVTPTPKVDNWRSKPTVVNFNNELFDQLRKRISSLVVGDGNTDKQIDTIYSECRQNARKKGEGFVRVNMFTGEGKDGVKEAEGARLQQLVDTIKDLHDNHGFKFSDMSILVRDKKSASSVISPLLQVGIPLITSDSLAITNSPIVIFIIAYLKYFTNRADRVSLAYIIKVRTEHEKRIEDFAPAEVREEAEQQISAQVADFVGLSLVEIVNSIIATLPKSVIEEQQVFLQAFMEFLRDTLARGVVNATDFLDEFDNRGKKVNVETPQNQDAVSLITIHKSKGLEYKVVLIPYCDWKFTSKNNNLFWVKINEAPFNKIPLVPLSFQNSLEETFAQDDYKNEVRDIAIDNLNLVYVALTRARNALIIWGYEGKSKNDKNKEKGLTQTTVGEHINQVIENVASTLNMKRSENAENNEITYELGVLANDEDAPIDANNYDLSTFVPRSLSEMDELKFSLESDKNDFLKAHEVLAYGNAMHFIMRYIRSTDDVPMAVKRAVQSGFFDEERAEAIINNLKVRLSQENVKSWFDGSANQVFTESTILTDSDAVRHIRPDRFMIDENGHVTIVDYKFGNEQQEHYREQVRSYIELMKKAGYEDVSGYLWYFELNIVEKIS